MANFSEKFRSLAAVRSSFWIDPISASFFSWSCNDAGEPSMKMTDVGTPSSNVVDDDDDGGGVGLEFVGVEEEADWLIPGFEVAIATGG